MHIYNASAVFGLWFNLVSMMFATEHETLQSSEL